MAELLHSNAECGIEWCKAQRHWTVANNSSLFGSQMGESGFGGAERTSPVRLHCANCEV